MNNPVRLRDFKARKAYPLPTRQEDMNPYNMMVECESARLRILGDERLNPLRRELMLSMIERVYRLFEQKYQETGYGL